MGYVLEIVGGEEGVEGGKRMGRGGCGERGREEM